MTHKNHAENEDKSPYGKILFLLGVMVVGLTALIAPIIKGLLEQSNPPWIIPWAIAAVLAAVVTLIVGSFLLSTGEGGAW